MKILAIETSCDETSIAVLQSEADGSFKLLSNNVSSQVKIHAPYGGVVPMIAKREHQKNLVPILISALKESGLLQAQSSKLKTQNHNLKLKTLETILNREPELLKKLLPFLKRYQKPNIDLIAVTNGPGLEPALWVGVNFAKALGYFWDLPIIPINHVEAHIIANWLSETSRQLLVTNGFPSLCLVVSGGHTQLILMRDFGDYKILGETRDDAAGEAFDKLAKMLNLGYPGGPIVAKLAKKISHPEARSAEGSPTNVDNEIPHTREILRYAQNDTITLPRPMLHSKDYDFSFSGLKTAALYFVKTLSPAQLKKLTPAICAEFQQAVVDVLVQKTIRAAKEFGAKTVLLSGGVASNDLLRETLKLETLNLKLNFNVPIKKYCTDNAAMIALTAFFARSKPKNWQEIETDSNLRLA